MDTLCVDFGLKKIEQKAYDVRVYLISTLPQNKPLNVDKDLTPILSMIDEMIGFIEALDEQDLDLLAKYAVKELGNLCRKAQNMLKELPRDKALKFPPYMRPICDVIIEIENLTEALKQHGKQLIKNEKQITKAGGNMNLQFLASIGLIPIHLKDLEQNIQIISTVQSAKDFSADNNGVTSGVFHHKEKKEIFALFTKKPQGTEVTLTIIKDSSLSKSTTLIIGKVGDDTEMQEAIFKLFVERNK